MQEFISEDDLKTFEGWFRFQGFDPATTPPEEVGTWRAMFDEVRARGSAIPKVGRMKLAAIVGGHRYAVAVREGSDLWLALWVLHSPKGEFFVMLPRGNRDWNVHASYHVDGTRHIKSHGRKALPDKRQPLTHAFRGTEPLVAFFGYGPKRVGAICDPTAFSGVVEIPSGVLGPRDGGITVDLIEPGCEPPPSPLTKIVKQTVFRDCHPWVAITVGSCG